MNVVVKVLGARTLVRKLKTFPERAKKLKFAIQRAALFIAGEAKKLTPVDTGRLRASITAKTEREGKWIVGRIGTNVQYAPHIEFGRKRIIEPVRARALRFTVKNPIGKRRLRRTIIFAKRVEAGRPGQKTATWERVEGERIAKPFLRPALKGSVDKVKQIVSEFIKQEILTGR